MATAALSDVVLPAPGADWLRSLPGSKLPDRGDFKAYGERTGDRQRDWRRAVSESQRLADEFANLVADGRPVQALPLP